MKPKQVFAYASSGESITLTPANEVCGCVPRMAG